MMSQQFGVIEVPKISRAGLAASKRQLDEAELALTARQPFWKLLARSSEVLASLKVR